MTYPYGGPGEYPTQSSAAYGAYWPQPTGAVNQGTPPAKRLVCVVLVLGLATYLISCSAVSPPGGISWGVRFSASAAVVAALGLFPRQRAHAKLVAALAVMGFLEAMSQLITGHPNPSWLTLVIVILNALQALTAIAALVAQPAEPAAADHGLAQYNAYAYYAQAAQQYYAADSQQQQRQQVQAHAMAQAKVSAPESTQQSAAERYALYTEYLSESDPNPAALSPQSGGRPPPAQPAAGSGTAYSGPAERVRQGNDPAAGSSTQSRPA
jgi:hypothetical protein